MSVSPARAVINAGAAVAVVLLATVLIEPTAVGADDGPPAGSSWTLAQMAAAVPVGPEEVSTDARLADEAAGESEAASATVAAGPHSADPRLGRVFYRVGPNEYSCSGTATTSANGDVVTTAAHCLSDSGALVSDFVFVPAYDGLASLPHLAQPYGVWHATELHVPSQWLSGQDHSYDVGFAVMGANAEGQSLTDVVGGYPIAFDGAFATSYDNYGYPAAAPYDGTTLWSCTGPIVAYVGDIKAMGVSCPMTGGASGGGWLADGVLRSVNSFITDTMPETMFGPTFDGVVQSLFEAASAG